MATRHFCDLCDEELTQDNRWVPDIPLAYPTGTKLGSVSLRVFAVEGRRDDDLEVCIHCIFDAVAKADDRPRAPAEQT